MPRFHGSPVVTRRRFARHGWSGWLARSLTVVLVCPLLSLACGAAEDPPAPAQVYDVVIYGATSGGVAAAVQVARMGRSVVLIEPSQRLGGLSTGGLGQTDIGNKQAIGGIAREFYQRVRRYYRQDSAWKWERASDYKSGGQSFTEAGEDTMWTFEPSVASNIFQDLVREHHVTVAYGQRLDLNQGVAVTRSRPWRILSLRMESGQVYRGRMFIDATYEGDLMAKSGVTYTVGREANQEFRETLNGVQTAQALKHQLRPGIDPYVVRGNPAGGLLPGIDASGPGTEGGADRRVQTYCFRMCLTDHPENRLPLVKPPSYQELDYELLLRNFEAGFNEVPWHNASMPNRKTDINNNHGFSTDFIGQNYEYPEGDYALRARIVQRHLDYQQGLIWTLANHPRVPEAVRREVSRWGPCRDEFMEGAGWQNQLYIREARRLVGALVMTQHHCQGKEVASDAVGLAAYTMDSHNVQRYVDAQGKVRNEGDVQVGGFPPFPIGYRALVPKADQCANLLVPVCLSATHIAFGSIRMEPVFMVLGQSAATAAVLALDADSAVQAVDRDVLRQRLLADRQVLAWSKPGAAFDLKSLKGLVVDTDEARIEGEWMASAVTGVFVGGHYLHDNNAGKGSKHVRYTLPILKSGSYEVRCSYTAHPNRASNVPVTVVCADGEKTVRINQRLKPGVAGAFVSLGVYRFEAGKAASVVVANQDADGYVVADAVQVIPVNNGPP